MSAVVLFEHANYEGWSIPLGLGTFNLINNNDQVSSVRVQPGYSVTLWEHIEAGGRSLRLTSDTPYVGQEFNDQTSWAVVEPYRETQGPNPPQGTPPPQTPNQDFITRVVELTNAERQRNGLAPLTMNAQLNAAAQAHAQDMALDDYFEHATKSTGESFGDRMSKAGYTGAPRAENITAGTQTPEDAVRSWIESPPHYQNMMLPDLRDIGVGFYLLENDTGNVNWHQYWVQDFGA
mmetsp:Transcript_16315/g.26944  ORF Transcript_16315/g.26944 Transcript_16315/m.26944 type:complete len:235 (-) Transcript_16315:477-1181(-)|eukprot:CAMPEP_0184665128 /NCGR_PEP_ID=MMETSP0308-20130426/55845_1 /TAXON_ID=38269 /ORGANISM="Gloeochaete witrockiana, Strain SAG 46.84" /LENGTH=234 /DNA_ID=CAMNT_0027108931 /DNA_START=258 /DNA_END=962 /DNA_ORIENTATION=-